MNESDIRQMLAEAGFCPADIARYTPAAQLMATMAPEEIREAVLDFIEQTTAHE